MTADKNIRIVFPLWQGGNNPAYLMGANLLEWLAPQVDSPTFKIPVDSYEAPLILEDGIKGRTIIKEHLDKILPILSSQNPTTITTLGGDCLVSLVPFAYLQTKYREKLGILWIDSHPDVQNSEQFSHAHAHVLGALLGHGDSDLIEYVQNPISASKVMIAGIHQPLTHEAEFISRLGISTLSPQDIQSSPSAIKNWLKSEKIEYLAIHIDLDVLDPQSFRSLLFAKPGRKADDFGGVAEGKLTITDVISLVKEATKIAKPIGLTIAEHTPWDAINLQKMLADLPLMSH